MKLAPQHLDDLALEALGAEAARLISTGNLRSLHARFGYALTFDRDPIEALTKDVATSLAEIGASGFGDLGQLSIKVRRFAPNGTGVSGVVECVVPANNGKQLAIELVLSTSGSESHLTLEQISAVV